VPYEYIEKPELHDEYTRKLIQANLVAQVIPGKYLDQIPGFKDSFVSYLESLGMMLDRRRDAFLHRKEPTYIHIEKMADIGDELVRMKLAVYKRYPWYDVESETASDFMSYLSTVLGRLRELQFTPVTDQIACLNTLSAIGRASNYRDREINLMRLQILEEALPSPATPLEPSQIELFKISHGKQLSSFRRDIELELTTLADIDDPDLQQRRLELIKERVREETADISDKVRQHGWQSLVFGKLCALLALVPAVGTVPKLINAVYKAFGGAQSFDKKSPLAYAAYAQKELLGTRRVESEQSGLSNI
jgi:hypothetical protein